MKFELFYQQNANVTETLLQNYYNDSYVVDLNAIWFQIAFAVHNGVTGFGYNDLTYVQWKAWMKSNANRGIFFPDELPWEPLLKNAEVFWGGFYSTPADWYPTQLKVSSFEKISGEKNWQFSDFLLSPRC